MLQHFRLESTDDMAYASNGLFDITEKAIRQDLEYRRAVSKLNDLKDKAFSFYVGEQNAKAFQDVLSVIDCGGPGELWTLSPVSDISSEEMIRGPFSPTRYINFLNGEVETLPIFGSPLDAPNGSRTLAKDILLPDYENATPLASVFSSVNPAEPVATSLASVTRTGVNGYFVDKGWLLGFMLVNLPTPLIQCNDERNLRRGVPRNVIASYLNPETEEYKLFLKIWPYTDGENIRLAAVAITQMRNSERFVEDVRTKWNPDVQRPLPIHQRLSSHSDHRHGNRTLS
ncbi:SubName: Full=Uncharacterized protein {ECO:0000313/EMBL:CCA76238.1} [Serendipita indica DSM 11827]|nr:SubName: Full=Uncharacterized protein {ECO:0000313/EMBL:CCA76238.1} [Serendipita indica DSM 11827]